jgi:hypothetical protein
MRKFLPLAAALAILLPAIALAQGRRDPGMQRGDRGERIARIIADCEQRTNEFHRAIERAQQRSEFRGRQQEDSLNRDASRLERELNIIRDSWNREHNPIRTRRYVGAAITAGRNINRALARHRLSPYVQTEWGAIRIELNNLAEVFEQPRIRW